MHTLSLAGLITVMVVSLSSSAASLGILTEQKMLDVGEAKLLAGQLNEMCKNNFNAPQQQFQCKNACGTLGKKVEGMATTINRENAPQRALKGDVEQFAQFTLGCGKIWQGKPTPQPLLPFVALFNSMIGNTGKLPVKGIPNGELTLTDSEYAAQMKQYSDLMTQLPAVCGESLFAQSCQKSCDIVPELRNLSRLVDEKALTQLEQLNEMTPMAKAIDNSSATVARLSRECSTHFGRNAPLSLQRVQHMTHKIVAKVSGVKQRELLAKAEAREIKKMQMAVAREDAQREKQLAYEQALEKMRACRSDSPFNGLSGCSYLTAVYDNDFTTAMELEYQSTAPFRKGWMGEGNQQLDEMLGKLNINTGDMRQKMYKSYNFIGRTLGSYITYYEYFYPQCMEHDAVVLTLTTQRQNEYRNGYGNLVRTEKLPDRVDNIRINKSLYPYVNVTIIDKSSLASVELGDSLFGALNKFPRIKLLDVTRGIGDAMRRHSCDSPEMQQMQTQMIKYYQQRKNYNMQFSL